MNEAGDYIFHVHHKNEKDDVIMIFKYVYDTCAPWEWWWWYMCYMCTKWTWWWIYDWIFVLCAPHKVLSHGTIMLRSGSYDDDDG